MANAKTVSTFGPLPRSAFKDQKLNHDTDANIVKWDDLTEVFLTGMPRIVPNICIPSGVRIQNLQLYMIGYQKETIYRVHLFVRSEGIRWIHNSSIKHSSKTFAHRHASF